MSAAVTQRLPRGGPREVLGFPRIESGVYPTYGLRVVAA
jgi:hypothetical protein